jgi:hypothetical protein
VNELPDRPTNLDLRRSVARMAGIGVLLAILTDAAFFVIDFRKSSSSFDAFREVKLTMPRAQAEPILAKHGIACTTSDTGVNDPSLCLFSDLWRTYTLSFDHTSGPLNAKRFYFRKRPGILKRLFYGLRGL